jgi:hypothetical protein
MVSLRWRLWAAFTLFAVIYALTACGVPPDITSAAYPGANTGYVPPVTYPPTSTSTPTPTILVRSDIVLQYDIGRQMAWNPYREQAFGHVPPFTLFKDGSVFYVEDHNTVMQAQLTPGEMQDLMQRVLDLGFERLETDLSGCIDSNRGDGSGVCVSEPFYEIIRVRDSAGVLREVTINSRGGKDPQAITAIAGLLDSYRHPSARPYMPAQAALFTTAIRGQPDEPDLPPWPLDPSWLIPLESDIYAVVGIVQGELLQTFLSATGGHLGGLFRHDGRQYSAELVPLLPGYDYTTAVANFAREGGISAPSMLTPTPYLTYTPSPAPPTGTPLDHPTPFPTLQITPRPGYPAPAPPRDEPARNYPGPAGAPAAPGRLMEPAITPYAQPIQATPAP